MTKPSIKKEVMLQNPMAILGKDGVTTQFVDHLLLLLKRHKIIKIKALKTALRGTDIKKMARKVAERTNSKLLDVRGKVFILSVK